MAVYFRLNPSCYLISGARRAAIYELMSGNMIWLEPEVAAFVRACEMNYTVEAAAAEAGLIEADAVNSISRLQASGVGLPYEQPIYVEHWRDRKTLKVKPFYEDPPLLQVAFIDLTNKCNLDCRFCRQGEGIRRFACLGCTRNQLRRPTLEVADRTRLLTQLRELECPVVVFGGGNPFMVEQTCAEAIRSAAQLGFMRIGLVTNGTGLSDKLLEQLAEHHAYLVVQVYSHLDHVHDAITRRPGSFRELHTNIERMLHAGLSLSFTLLVTNANQDALADTLAHYQAFSSSPMTVDYLYPGPEGGMNGTPMALVDKLVIKKSDLMSVNIHQFFDRQEFNPCLRGKLAVTADGFLLPCPAMPDHQVGDVQSQDLQTLLAEGRLDEYWGLTKDQITNCQQCEFRYACMDCRALHAHTTGELYGLAYCMYDPAVGVWREDCTACVTSANEREGS